MKRVPIPDNLPPDAVVDAVCTVVDKAAKALGVVKPLFVMVMYEDQVKAHSIGDVLRDKAIVALRQTADRIEDLEDQDPDVRALKRLLEGGLMGNGRKGGGP